MKDADYEGAVLIEERFNTIFHKLIEKDDIMVSQSINGNSPSGGTLKLDELNRRNKNTMKTEFRIMLRL